MKKSEDENPVALSFKKCFYFGLFLLNFLPFVITQNNGLRKTFTIFSEEMVPIAFVVENTKEEKSQDVGF